MTQSGTGLSNDRRHGNKAKNGCYRYDTRFGIPVYSELGEIERYNIFRARMLVRCDENNKLYLYDIVQIKKETSTPLDTNLHRKQSEKTDVM